MRFLTDYLLDKPRLVYLLMAGLLFGGYQAYKSIPTASTPDIKVPYVIVNVPWPGSSSSSVEKSLTNPLETKMDDLEELKSMRSYSVPGFSFLILEFNAGYDLDRAINEVQNSVDESRSLLPSGIETPDISEIAFEEVPIVILTVSGEMDPEALKREALLVVSEIEKLDGLASVELFGAKENTIQIEPNPSRLRQKGLTLAELSSSVQQLLFDMPIGALDTGSQELQISYRGKSETVKEISNLIIPDAYGNSFLLSDIASIKISPKKITTYSRHNGQKSINIVVKKTTGENTVKVGESVFSLIDDLNEKNPNLKIEIAQEQVSGVRDELIGVMVNNLSDGFWIVIIVLILFVGFKNSLLVALGIPLALGFSLIIANSIGYSLNNVTVFGIIIVLGMLVDDDIIVVENIFRQVEKGMPPKQAARKGIHQVSMPITAAILTTIAAFGPLMFLSGTMGEFMKYVPAMVIFTLTGALITGHFILPSICAIFMKQEKKKNIFTGIDFSVYAKKHQHIVSNLIKKPWKTLAVFVFFFIASMSLVPKLLENAEFFPKVSMKEFIIDIEAPWGTSVEITDSIAKEVERVLDTTPEIDFYTTSVGDSGENVVGTIGGGGGPHFARITGSFYEKHRKEAVDEHQPNLQQIFDEIPGAKIQFVEITEGPPAGNDIIIRALGNNYDDLIEYTDMLESIMLANPVLTEIDRSHQPGNPELKIQILEDKAAKLSVAPFSIANESKNAFDGSIVMRMPVENQDEDADVIIRYPEEFRKKISDLSLVSVRNNLGFLVPIDMVSKTTRQVTPVLFSHWNGKKTISISANVKPQGPPSQIVLEDIKKIIESSQIPNGITIEYGGENEEAMTGQSEMGTAFLVAIGLISLLLVAVFNSFRQSMVVITAIPFALIGVIVALLISGESFGFLALMGVVALTGIVVNDSIVLIDRINQLREQGMNLMESVSLGTSQRLRPILMTSVTTIGALIPMSLDTTGQAEWFRALGVSIMGGLAVGTFLIIYLIPCLYVMAEKRRGAKNV